MATLTLDDFYQTGRQDCGNTFDPDDFDLSAGTTSQEIVDAVWTQDEDEDAWLEQQDDFGGLDPHEAYQAWSAGWKACAVAHVDRMIFRALLEFSTEARDDEREAHPIGNYELDKFGSYGELINTFRNDMDRDFRNDWIARNRRRFGGAITADLAWDAYREAYVSESETALAMDLEEAEAEFPEPGIGNVSPSQWLTVRQTRSRNWSHRGEEAFELEAAVRSELAEQLLKREPRAVRGFRPRIADLEHDPSIVRSLLDPELRMVAWKFFRHMDWWNVVLINVHALNLGLRSDDEGYAIMEEVKEALDRFYPRSRILWEPVHQRPRELFAAVTKYDAIMPTENPDRVPGGLARGMKPSDFDPVALARGTKVELEHTSDRRIAQEIAMDHLVEDPRYYEKLATIEKNPPPPRPRPKIWLLFDSARGTTMPRAFAREMRRQHVLGLTHDDWDTLEEGDTPENEWVWETWDYVLQNALIVEKFATHAPALQHLLDVAHDAKEEGKTAYYDRIMREYRIELGKIEERVMERAMELDAAGKTTERDDLLNDHNAIVFKLWQTENGDVFAIPWDMEWDEDADEWIWPECADCGQSTAVGTPCPHICGESVNYEKNPKPGAVLRRPWRNATIVLELGTTGYWIPWLESSSGQRLPISARRSMDADEVFRDAERFLASVQTSEFTRKGGDDEPDLNPRSSRRVRRNPGSAQLEDAKAKFEEFHSKKPTEIGEFGSGFAVPSKAVKLGDAVHVLYRSNKKDPATGRQPKKPVDYIHEHDAGVCVYLPDDVAQRELEENPGADVDVPDFVVDADALVLLGECLGFRYRGEDDIGRDAEATDPLPELYATPCGRALLVVQGKREILALIWGGALGVWARGIDG